MDRVATTELHMVFCRRCSTPLFKIRPAPGVVIEIKCRRCGGISRYAIPERVDKTRGNPAKIA